MYNLRLVYENTYELQKVFVMKLFSDFGTEDAYDRQKDDSGEVCPPYSRRSCQRTGRVLDSQLSNTAHILCYSIFSWTEQQVITQNQNYRKIKKNLRTSLLAGSFKWWGQGL